jgi:CheY-like chemotaxis protein
MNPTRRRVLLVEDDYYVASSLALGLETEGIEVLGPVGSVASALAAVAETARIDGAVLDVNLNGEMVYPVADRLRERGIPYVFTTGYDTESVAQRDPDARCFEKPVIATRLVEALFEQER